MKIRIILLFPNTKLHLHKIKNILTHNYSFPVSLYWLKDPLQCFAHIFILVLSCHIRLPGCVQSTKVSTIWEDMPDMLFSIEAGRGYLPPFNASEKFPMHISTNTFQKPIKSHTKSIRILWQKSFVVRRILFLSPQDHRATTDQSRKT